MCNQVSHEWGIEHTDKYGDINDYMAVDCLSDLCLNDLLTELHEGHKPVLVLRRLEGNDIDGEVSCYYCYPDVSLNGFKLPQYYKDCYQQNITPLPKFIKKEFNKWVIKNKLIEHG